MFDSLTSKFGSAFSSLRSRGRIKASDIDEIVLEIKTALVDSDVALEVAEKFTVHKSSGVYNHTFSESFPARAELELLLFGLFSPE